MAIRFFDRNIPDECHQKIQAFTAAGDDIVWVAFPPAGGNSWSVVAKSGAFFNRNIPDECHEKMQELSKGGAKIVRVAFPPEGGNRWSIVNDQGAYFNRNIPDECHQQMGELSKNGARIVSVAFPPAGGNSWSIVNNQGAYFNRNIPDECHQQMGELSKNGARIVCVAFPKQGGNSWSIVNDRGAYFNRNIAEEAHMIMGYFTEVYGPVSVVAFDTSGNSWSVMCRSTKAEKICGPSQCVSVADVYDYVAARMRGRVVGYACTIGSASTGGYAWGYARTGANAPVQPYLPSTKMTVASVSKVVTALAAIRFLGKHNIALTDPIGPYLPSDWNVAPYVKTISFAQLLSHTSGIKDYGNWGNDLDGLKQFFTQPVDLTKNTTCQGADKVNVPYAINPIDKSGCYSNFNFAIFRVLLPMIEGFSDNSPDRAAKLGAAYVRIVQQNVFEPVGAMGVDTKPPTTGAQATEYAYAYEYPGNIAGFDWKDNTLIAGAAGWYLSIDDIGRVLYSLNANDERILTKQQLKDMQALNLAGIGTVHLGWDAGPTDGPNASTGNTWFEKNGGWSGPNGEVQTTIALFKPGQFDGPGLYGALFANSNIIGPGRQTEWKWCKKCLELTFAANPSVGSCAAGGQHDHSSSMDYMVANTSSGIAGQSNWRWCTKCQALTFAGGAAGACSAGGIHDHSGSGDYVLAFRGSGPLPLDEQDQWHWCNKCQALTHVGGGAVSAPCAAGGQHDVTGSGNYLLETKVGVDTILHEAFVSSMKPKV